MQFESKYLRRNEASDYLTAKHFKCATTTLAKLAVLGGGPVFQKYGRFPVYTVEALDAWAASRLSPPTTSTSAVAA